MLAFETGIHFTIGIDLVKAFVQSDFFFILILFCFCVCYWSFERCLFSLGCDECE